VDDGRVPKDLWTTTWPVDDEAIDPAGRRVRDAMIGSERP